MEKLRSWPIDIKHLEKPYEFLTDGPYVIEHRESCWLAVRLLYSDYPASFRDRMFAACLAQLKERNPDAERVEPDLIAVRPINQFDGAALMRSK